MERISLSNAAFEGDNNVYVFDDGPETVLIDTGDGTEETRRQLEAGLADVGVTFADVDRVFLTHWHGDHTGLAGHIQAQSGADVFVHEADAPLVGGDADALADLRARRETYFDEWGCQRRSNGRSTSGSASTKRRARPRASRRSRTVIRSLSMATNSRSHIGPVTLPACVSSSVTWTGDATCSVATPSSPRVHAERQGRRRPGRAAAAKVPPVSPADSRRGLRRAWPGHRSPIDAPAERAAEIIHHHEERAWRVLDVLEQRGPADTWTVSAELFGDLHGIHVLHGPGERRTPTSNTWNGPVNSPVRTGPID